MKVKDILKQLDAQGWRQVRIKGSHRQFQHPYKSGTVTVAGKLSVEIPPGTLKSIQKQAALEWDEEMKYAVVIEKGPESFGAYVPDLPGCIAVGETRADVVKLIQEAIELHLQGLQKQGECIPPPLSTVEIVSVAA